MTFLTYSKENNSSFSLPLYLSKKIEIPEQNSDYYSIIFIPNGEISLPNSNINLFSPGVLCISPNHTISQKDISSIKQNEKNDNFYSLIFKPSGINSTFKEFPNTFEYKALNRIQNYNFIPLNSTFTDKIRLLLSQIDEELNENQSSFWPCLTRSYILELILLIDRIEYSSLPNSVFTIPQSNQKTQEIFQYIHNYYNKEITLDSLSKLFSTNRTTLNSIFKQACGTSVIKYLNKIRLEIATLMLRNTALSISDIAIRSGFFDESYFSRIFKEKVGLAPSEYRKTIPNPYGK